MRSGAGSERAPLSAGKPACCTGSSLPARPSAPRHSPAWSACCRLPSFQSLPSRRRVALLPYSRPSPFPICLTASWRVSKVRSEHGTTAAAAAAGAQGHGALNRAGRRCRMPPPRARSVHLSRLLRVMHASCSCMADALGDMLREGGGGERIEQPHTWTDGSERCGGGVEWAAARGG